MLITWQVNTVIGAFDLHACGGEIRQKHSYADTFFSSRVYSSLSSYLAHGAPGGLIADTLPVAIAHAVD